MKTLILLLVMLCSVSILKAQNKITGFGILKLGSPTTIITGLGMEIKPISDNSEYVMLQYNYRGKFKIFEIIADSTKKYPISISSLDPRVKAYYITKYAVTSAIEITNVKLRFFNDSLIEINCDKNEQLAEALTLKYGDPKVETKEEPHQFTYTYTGNTVTKTDVTYTSEWPTNDLNIKCSSTLMKWYNSEGKESYVSYIDLINMSHDDDIKKAEDIIKNRIEERELKIKRQKLGDI